MRPEVQRDLDWAAKDFARLVIPIVGPKLKGRLVSAESTVFDVLSGIDAWQIDPQLGIRGIAVRVQRSDRNWGTFTIRLARPNGATTEVEKRLRSLALATCGWLMPHLTIQAYVSAAADRLLAVAIVESVPFYTAVRDHLALLPTRRNPSDGVLFLAVPIAWLRSDGLRVWTYDNDPPHDWSRCPWRQI